jgi:hypothetical protein
MIVRWKVVDDVTGSRFGFPGFGQCSLSLLDDGVLHLVDDQGASRWNSGGTVWQQLGKKGEEAGVAAQYVCLPLPPAPHHTLSPHPLFLPPAPC